MIILFVIFIIYFLFLRKLYSTPNITKGNSHIKASKLMIVAHPDDEVIFGGRYLIESGWKVVCITNQSLKSNNKFSFNSRNFRMEEFISVMNATSSSYEIWDFEDNNFNSNFKEDILIPKLLNLITETSYEKILTHNLKGEYGHPQHKRLSKILHLLKPPNLYTFHTDPNIINPSYHAVNRLLKLYHSQSSVVDKLQWYILHQSIKMSIN